LGEVETAVQVRVGALGREVGARVKARGEVRVRAGAGVGDRV
jgi:hypothetical protein